MTKPEVYEDHMKALEMNEKLEQLKQEADTMLEEWTELQEELIVYNVSFTLRPAAMSVFYVYNQQYFFNTTIFPPVSLHFSRIT